MKPAPLHLVRALTLGDVWRAQKDALGDAKVIAGGQSLVALLNLRLATPSTLIDLSGIEELRELKVSPERIRVGAMVTQRRVEHDAEIRRFFPVLSRAVSQIGHPQIRSRGTIGGNVAHADPSSELPALMVLAEATMEIVGPRGRRKVRAAEFFRGPYTTALDDEEILAGMDIGAAAMARRYGFHEIARCRGAFAMTGAIASIDADPSSIRVALFGVAPSPALIELGARGLMDVWGTSDFDRATLEYFTATLAPNDDFQATALQRLSYAVVCTKEAVHELIG